MQTIEIDFEVFKALTARRTTESVTYNDVIRSLLGLNATSATTRPGAIWVYKDVAVPVGTRFRAHYKGQTHHGEIEPRGLVVEGVLRSSPSDAAKAITNTNVNGWTFWECQLPGSSRWRAISSLRDRS